MEELNGWTKAPGPGSSGCKVNWSFDRGNSRHVCFLFCFFIKIGGYEEVGWLVTENEAVFPIEASDQCSNPGSRILRLIFEVINVFQFSRLAKHNLYFSMCQMKLSLVELSQYKNMEFLHEVSCNLIKFRTLFYYCSPNTRPRCYSS